MAGLKKIAFLLPLLGLFGCSMRGVALRSTTELLETGVTAYYNEPDWQLAREALGSQLKFVEGLLESDPGNLRLLLLAAEGFGGYAFLFCEDSQPVRAKAFYLRGRDYAFKALARRSRFRNLAAMSSLDAERALAQAVKEDAPGLFWAAFCWSGFINLARDSPEAIADLPKAALLMKRAHELGPEYHFAGSDLFFGVYFASRPKLLGGDTEKARAHFRWAERITQGKYLMTYVLEARYLAVALQDRTLFETLLSKVKETTAGALPGARLADEVAKLKAAALLEKVDELF